LTLLLVLLLQAPLPEATPPAEPPAAETAEAPVPSGPVLRDVVIVGATAFDTEALRDVVRLRPGAPLRRGPDAVAKVLETYYRLEGYPAARVTATFDEAASILTLSVSEGRLVELEVEGLEGRAEERAKRALGLEIGKPVREGDIWVGLSRLQEETLGALRPAGDPPYVVEETDEGVRLAIHTEKDRARLYIRGAGPRTSGRYNRVDGFAPGVRLELALSDFNNYNHFRIGALAAYGFSSKKLRYAIGISRGVGSAQKTTYGYDYHDITDTDDVFRKSGLDEAPRATINTQQALDFFRRLGHEAFVYHKFKTRAQLGLLFRSDYYSSVPVTTIDGPISPDSDDFNPPVEEGRMRSFIASMRLVSEGELFESFDSEIRAVGQPSLYGTDWFRKPQALRFDATLEIARPGLGSDFNFSRFISRVRFHQDLSDHLALDGGFLLGLSGGDPPLPKRFALGGLNTLRGFERKQFQGEKMALATLEWTVYRGGQWPALIGFWDGGTAWKNVVGPDVGWRNDLGLGVRWPPRTRGIFGRFELAWPIHQVPGRDRGPRYNLRVQLPI
jgi:outer membrane protein assembly factor BamA